MKTDFHNKDFALSLALKWRRRWTRKWPIHKYCFAYLQQLGLSITIFVSDRHRGIAKWIRETCVDTINYFNIWHVATFFDKITGYSLSWAVAYPVDLFEGYLLRMLWYMQADNGLVLSHPMYPQSHLTVHLKATALINLKKGLQQVSKNSLNWVTKAF